MEGVQCRWQTGFEVSQNQLLEALHDGGGECNRAEVIKACCLGVFWYLHDKGGLMHVGRAAWASDRLKMSVKTLVSCPAQAMSTHWGKPSGPAALSALVLFSTHVGGGEYEGLVVFGEHNLDGRLLFVPVLM